MHTHKTTTRTLLCYLAIGLIALALRVADLGLFLTHDEAEFWFTRSESLLNALQSGNYSEMAVSTHPGVTTMWLGGAGILLRRFLFESGLLSHETFPLVLALHRLPTAFAHVGGILLGYHMLRRLLPTATATLAALLWAADPFVIGYSRLLHVDALTGTFATLSLLSACVYASFIVHHSSLMKFRWLVLSGLCAALAVLSKSPALAVGPVVGILLLAEARRRGGEEAKTRDGGASFIAQHSSCIVPLLLWVAAAALTVLSLWPALWSDPRHVYEALRAGIEAEGAQPHMTGNFFLGQRNPAPGPLYYPVVLALRMTPWTLAGVVLLALVRGQGTGVRGQGGMVLVTLAGFILLFTLGMSLFPKKFDRYLVPVFPALDILAAIGLAWAARRLLPTRPRIILAIIGGIALFNAAWYHPYHIAYFNQALGGTRTGARTVVVGWGEGLEQAAAWLNQQPDITDVLTISHMVSSISPYMRDGARATFPRAGTLKEGAGYVVVYRSQVQGGAPPPPFNQFYGYRHPLHTVTIHGVEYAWVYQAPPPIAQRLPARFGSTIALYGYQQQTTPQRGHPLTLHLVWETLAPPTGDYWLFAYLLDSNGTRHAQIDRPLHTRQWEPGRFIPTEIQLTLPADLPAGDYHIAIGLYDPATGQRRPLHVSPPTRAAPTESDALLLMPIHLDSQHK